MVRRSFGTKFFLPFDTARVQTSLSLAFLFAAGSLCQFATSTVPRFTILTGLRLSLPHAKTQQVFAPISLLYCFYYYDVLISVEGTRVYVNSAL